MQEIKTELGTFKVWDSIKELPINRYTDFNKYIIQDAGIGGTIESVSNHFKNLHTFLAAGKINESRIESYNLHYNFFVMINKIPINSLSFACFVVSINEEEIGDYSETNLLNIVERLGKIKLNAGRLEEIFWDVKKKLIPN